MKKLFAIAFITLMATACSNNGKTEEQEKIERDSLDKVQLDINQHYVDSIEKAADLQEQESESQADSVQKSE